MMDKQKRASISDAITALYSLAAKQPQTIATLMDKTNRVFYNCKQAAGKDSVEATPLWFLICIDNEIHVAHSLVTPTTLGQSTQTHQLHTLSFGENVPHQQKHAMRFQ